MGPSNGISQDALRRLDYKAWKNRYPEAYERYRKTARESARRIHLYGVWSPGKAGRPPIDSSTDEYAKEKKS